MPKYQVFKKVVGDSSTTEGDVPLVSFEPLGPFEGHDPQSAVEAAIVASDDPKELAKASFGVTADSGWRELTPTSVEVETKVRFA